MSGDRDEREDPRDLERRLRAEARQLEAACAADPADTALQLRTALLLDRLGREASAAGHYETALGQGLPVADERVALVCLGSTYRNLGRHDEARRTLERARRRHPGDAVVESFYALVLLDAGEAARAVRTLGLALVDAAGPDTVVGFEDALRAKFRGVTQRRR